MAVVVKTVVIVIVAPLSDIYKSLHERAKSLADQLNITADFKRARSSSELKTYLDPAGQYRRHSLCVCWDITDGDEDTAEEFQQLFASIWNERTDPWLSARPLVAISDSDRIVQELLLVKRRYERPNSGIFLKLPTIGTNRWQNIRDAIREGIRNA